MDQWTLQMGYPVITILGNTTAENRIIITQQHFIYDISAKTKAHEPQNNRYNSFFYMNKNPFFLHFNILKRIDNRIMKCT